MGNSSSSASATSSAGIGIFGLAFLVLLVFKLAGLAGVSWGLANLSWFWVISPLLFGVAWVIFWLVVAVLFVAFLDR